MSSFFLTISTIQPRSFLQPISLIVLSWAVFFLLFMGLGNILLFRRQGEHNVDQAPQGTDYLFQCFWTGWAILIFALQIWHFWLPVNDWALAFFATLGIGGILGIGGLLWGEGGLLESLRAMSRRDVSFLLIILLAAFFVALRTLGPPLKYDTGLYHISAIRWNQSFAIVPGLGNLHGRLAFNNSSFLFNALLENGPWAGRSSHIANGLLIMVLLARILVGARNMLWKKDGLADRFMVLMLTPVIVQLLDVSLVLDVTSFSPDLPIFVLGIVIVGEIFSIVDMTRRIDTSLAVDASRRNHSKGSLLFIAILASVGITIKLSFCVFAVLSITAAFYIWHTNFRTQRQALMILALALIIAGFAIPWMARGIILSGYPAYPAALGAARVEWRIPTEKAREEAALIKAWARAPGEPSSKAVGWAWILPWAKKTARRHLEVGVPMLCGIAALILLLARGRQTIGSSRLRQYCLILAIPIGALVFWFIAAPSIRFAGAAFWIFGMASVTFAFETISRGYQRILIAASSLALAFFAVASMLVLGHISFFRPGPDHGFPLVPKAEMKTYTTNSGLILNVPTGDDRCWDAPLPCTPTPPKELRLRREGDMSKGFILEQDLVKSTK